jgi:hypothetical protein
MMTATAIAISSTPEVSIAIEAARAPLRTR